MEEIWENCSHILFWKKCHYTRFGFSIIKGIIINLIWKNGKRLNIVKYFCKRNQFRCLNEFWISFSLSRGFFYYYQLRFPSSIFQEHFYVYIYFYNIIFFMIYIYIYIYKYTDIYYIHINILLLLYLHTCIFKENMSNHLTFKTILLLNEYTY